MDVSFFSLNPVVAKHTEGEKVSKTKVVTE